MRMLLFSLFVLQYLIYGTCSAMASDKFRDEFLIRRAYLDVLNVVPTIEEIDWYIVYNKNSYQLAVDYLLSRDIKSWNIDNQVGKILLTSKEYKLMPLRPLSKDTLDRCIMYVVGDLKTENTSQSVDKSIEKLLKLSEIVSSDTLDRIDYICSCLMSRTTTVAEANTLLAVFRSKTTEQDAWTAVIDCILQLPDVCCK